MRHRGKLRPLTPILNNELRRGGIAAGNTPGAPVGTILDLAWLYQDWRGLGGLPAGWTSIGDSPDYTADGVSTVASASTESVRLTASSPPSSDAGTIMFQTAGNSPSNANANAWGTLWAPDDTGPYATMFWSSEDASAFYGDSVGSYSVTATDAIDIADTLHVVAARWDVGTGALHLDFWNDDTLAADDSTTESLLSVTDPIAQIMIGDVDGLGEVAVSHSAWWDFVLSDAQMAQVVALWTPV